MFLRDNQWTIERFQYSNFKKDFLENENLFPRTEVPFLVESTRIENASFPYKTAISKARVKTDRMVSTKWTYYRERSFALCQYLLFLKKNKNFVSV